MSTYVIGDIHGEIAQLKTIMEKIDYQPDQDQLIFLGDYVDRGENPYEVYKYIKQLDNGRNIFLKGNHEEMMIDAVLNKNNVQLWYHNGGGITEDSFPNPSKLEEAASWFDSLPYYHADNDYIFVHAGIVPSQKLEEQRKHDLVWIRYEFINAAAEKFVEDRTIIAGHTPVADVQFLENKILMDTGAGKGGILTAIKLENKKIFQSRPTNPLKSLL